MDEVIASLATLSAELTWAEASPAVVPLLERRRPLVALERPVSVYLEPGLRVGFGVDVGPAFLHLTGENVERWQVGIGRIARQAIANLRERAHRIEPGAAIRTRFGVVPLSVLQASDGCASSLLLAPDLLPRWFGDGPKVFIAPGRNLLVALPPAADRRLVRFLHDQLAEATPDSLSVPAFAWSGGRLRRADLRDEDAAGSRAWRSRAAEERAAERPPQRWQSPAQGARTTWYTPPPARSVR